MYKNNIYSIVYINIFVLGAETADKFKAIEKLMIKAEKERKAGANMYIYIYVCINNMYILYILTCYTFLGLQMLMMSSYRNKLNI